MLKVALLTLLFVALANANTRGDVTFQICDSLELAVIRRFGVSGCADGSESCEFVVGQSYDFEVEVEVLANHPSDVLSLPFEVTARIFGLPFTLADGDACEYTDCPVQPGTVLTIAITREIPSALPQLNNVIATARVWANEEGNDNNASACASITVFIIRPLPQ